MVGLPDGKEIMTL